MTALEKAEARAGGERPTLTVQKPWAARWGRAQPGGGESSPASQGTLEETREPCDWGSTVQRMEPGRREEAPE